METSTRITGASVPRMVFPQCHSPKDGTKIRNMREHRPHPASRGTAVNMRHRGCGLTASADSSRGHARERERSATRSSNSARPHLNVGTIKKKKKDNATLQATLFPLQIFLNFLSGCNRACKGYVDVLKESRSACKLVLAPKTIRRTQRHAPKAGFGHGRHPPDGPC